MCICCAEYNQSQPLRRHLFDNLTPVGCADESIVAVDQICVVAYNRVRPQKQFTLNPHADSLFDFVY